MTIGDRIRNLRKRSGLTQVDLARKARLTSGQVSEYESGRFEPKIDKLSRIADALGVSVAVLDPRLMVPPSKSAPAPLQEVRAPARDGSFVPIISSAAAASCNPGIMPLLDCVSQYSEETAYFRQAKPGDFAIEVTGSSMSPWYPEGTLLLVRPYQDLRNGQRVVVVLDEGEVVFKIYAAKGRKICLFSIDGEGRDYIFEKPRVPIRYICRVIASQRNEDDLDAEMAQHNILHDWQLKLNEVPEE